MEPLHVYTLVVAILMIPIMIIAVYLTFREREKHTQTEDLLRDVQVLWFEVDALNREIVARAKANGIQLPMAPRESPFPDLI